MLSSLPTVFLFDVDNTLLDNDHFTADLTARLTHDFGKLECERYWRIYGEFRQTLGYADYLATLQSFRTCSDSKNDFALLKIADFLLDYPFDQRLYADAIAAIKHLSMLGTTAILSDGDIVFQPRKIDRSGLWLAFAGRVMITVHKEQNLEAMQARFPATHYVMIDDKPRLLAAMKKILGEKLTTVFVRQGHYALESFNPPISPAPDVVIEGIGELLNLTLSHFLAPATPAPEKK
jgi:FMN phosphatase YigB (HAD superfamily)